LNPTRISSSSGERGEAPIEGGPGGTEFVRVKLVGSEDSESSESSIISRMVTTGVYYRIRSKVLPARKLYPPDFWGGPPHTFSVHFCKKLSFFGSKLQKMG
jgi:hypothetical protein